MAGALGRVLVGGKDRGAGFSLAPGLVVTANHVVRDRGDKPVAYVPAGGEPVGVEQVQELLIAGLLVHQVDDREIHGATSRWMPQVDHGGRWPDSASGTQQAL